MRSVSKSSKRPSSVQSEGGVSVSGGKVVEVNHVESRPLVDIDEKSTFWFGESYEWLDNSNDLVNGAIVRICPPANWTDAEIAGVEQQLRDAGAAAVKVVRREVVVMDPNNKTEITRAHARTHREIINALLERVTHETPKLLKDVVCRALDEGAKQIKPTIVPRGNAAIYVKTIRLFNWQRFKGQHVVELDSRVYAITAEHESHEGRSNWLGKSSFLGAIPFALYGWHTRPKEDAWITDGESEGGVSIVLSDGTTIIRKRVRGKSTQLVVVNRSDATQSSGDEAQKEINARVGLSEADFFSTSFFVQKTIGQFVTMQPAKRQELIAGWLALGPLRAAEDWARDMLDQAVGQEAKCRESLIRFEQTAKQIEDVFGNPGTPTQVEVVIAQWEARSSAALKEAQEAAAQVRAQNQSAEHALACKRVIEQARAATTRAADELKTAESDTQGIDRLSLQSNHERAKEEHRKACDEYTLASKEAGNRKLLLVSGFDGQCPVARIECPAKEAINTRRDDAESQYRAASKVVSELESKRRETGLRLTECEQAINGANIKANRFREAMRAYDVAMKTEISLGDMPVAMPFLSSLDEYDAKAQQSARDVERARMAREQYQAAQEGIVKAKQASEQAVKEAGLYGAAARLLGRGDGGAQKEIAVGALAVIESNTNRSLGEAGIDLRVSLKWGTESTTELATYCNKCGASFPASKRVKTCGRCNAERGPKIDEKVDFSLSKVSGAAQDLAGFHLQIAAAAWLYGQRGVPWRMVAVDEPFGALDEAHRKTMGVHVASLLRSRYAFEQAFVIAHDVGSTDAMPARIRIIADDESSRVEVES